MREIVHMALPMDGRIWRVEWIGDVRRNPFSPKELEVRVAFRRFTKEQPPRPSSTSREEYVGVGTLCNLPLGSLWRDGRYVGDDEAARLTVDLDFSSTGQKPDTISYRMVAAPQKNRANTFGGLRVPAAMGSGYVMEIRLARQRNRARTICIPLFEVARSWFLRDSELALRLLSNPLAIAIDGLFDPQQSVINQTQTLLALRPGLSEGAIPIVAMLATSEYARLVAGRMVNRIVKAFMTQTSATLEALPPHPDRWNIDAYGRWGEKNDRGTFYVHRMASIELPAMGPIEWFTTEVHSDEVRRDGSLHSELGEHPGSLGRENRVRVNHYFEPSARRGNVYATVKAPPIMNPPELTRRPPQIEPTRNGEARKRQTGSAVVPDQEVSSGIGTSWDAGVAGFRYKSPDIGSDGTKSFLPAGLEQLSKIALELKSDPEMRVRSVGGSANQIGPENLVRTQMPEQIPWSYVDGRIRNALCFEITFRSRHFYLMEVERRFDKEELSACLVGLTSGRGFKPEHIDQVLREYARHRGSWTSVRQPFWKRTLAHKFKSETTFVKRLREILVAHVEAASSNSTGDTTLDPASILH